MPLLKEPLPVGVVAIWAGRRGAVPKGWVICDGKNGSPDLRGEAGHMGVTAYIMRVK